MKAVNIFRTIEASILRGERGPGSRLPTVREAAEHWGVNKNTAATAYRMLQEAGLVVASGRNGSVVAGRQKAMEEDPQSQPSPSRHDLHDGNPDFKLLPPASLITQHLRKSEFIRQPYGQQRNASALCRWMSTNFEEDGVNGAQLFVGHGTLDAIAAALRACANQGDRVAVEDPCYATTRVLLQTLGLHSVPLSLDSEGVTPDSLRSALTQGCKAVILTTRAHNPTGICMSQRRAEALAPIVGSAGEVVFIDDDHSSMLALAPYRNLVAAHARQWLVIRSVSKFLGPELRVAIAAGDEHTIGRLNYLQSVVMGWVSPLLQGLVADLLEDPRVHQLVRNAGQTYQRRFQALRDGLAGTLGIDLPGTAGLNAWIPCENPPGLCGRLLQDGWRVRSGEEFAIRSQPGIRVTCASLREQDAPLLIDALKGALGAAPLITA